MTDNDRSTTIKNNLLIEVCQSGKLEDLIELVNNGVDIHVDNDRALFKATRYGHIDIIEYLFKNGVDLSTNRNRALKIAIVHDHFHIVKWLHSNTVDIHKYNNIALKFAVCHGNFHIVKYLLQNGAEINYMWPHLRFIKISCDFYIEDVYGTITALTPEIQSELQIFNNKMIKIKSAKKSGLPS